MNKAEQSLPGVTLTLRGAREYQVAGKKKAEITLTCDIEDKDVWEAVQKMFSEGFRVFTQEDFKGELLNAFKEEMAQLEKKIRVLSFEAMHKDTELVRLRGELGQKKELLDGLDKLLQG